MTRRRCHPDTLASADGETARAMVEEVTRAAVNRLATETLLGVSALAAGGTLDLEAEILSTWAEWYEDALETLDDVELGGTSPSTRRAMDEAASMVRATLIRSLDELRSSEPGGRESMATDTP